MADSTITLLQTIEWAKRFTFRRPMALGNYLEPAVSSANTVLQTIVGAPFRWRWNRTVIGFTCVTGQQDYLIMNGWQANFILTSGSSLVDPNGNIQQSSSGTTGNSQPTWNTGLNATTTDNTVTWTNKGPAGSGASSAYSLNWIETASVLDTNPTSQTTLWKEMYPKIGLALESEKTLPKFISAQFDDGKGNITFRLQPSPYSTYPISIMLQEKPPIITSLSSTWAPIPDEYSRLYNWGFLSLMMLYADDMRFQYANQKFISNLLSSNEGLTETEINVVLNNWQQITGAPISKADTLQQGFQGRIAL